MMISLLMPWQLASRKTLAVAGNMSDHIVIGADTIVVHEGTVYPKPSSHERGNRIFKKLFRENTYRDNWRRHIQRWKMCTAFPWRHKSLSGHSMTG